MIDYFSVAEKMGITDMTDHYCLNNAQLSIWIAQQLDPDNPVYNVTEYYDIKGEFDAGLFSEALAVALRQISVLTGAVRSRGPELDIQGEILPGWNTIATYSNTDIIVTKGNTTVGNPDYPAVGNRYFGVPRNTGSFWNTYEFQDETLKGLKFGGGVTLRDGMLGWGGDNISRPVPGYITVDLMSSYSLKIGNSKVSAQLNVNNLLDKYYYTSTAYSGNSSLSPGGYSAAYVNFGMPRSLMGSIKVEF
jgi:iron complex outermembrane receptor protein